MNRAVFLDRDGVINYDTGYVGNIESFNFINGIFDLARAAMRHGYHLIVVTNQAGIGIGRGYYTEEEFLRLTAWMKERFDSEGAPLTDVFYCPSHPEFGIGHYRVDSYDRKPNPGMLLRAGCRHGLNMAESIMIGDKESDMEAALNAGVGTRCFLSLSEAAVRRPQAATHLSKSLYQAKELLFRHPTASAGQDCY